METYPDLPVGTMALFYLLGGIAIGIIGVVILDIVTLNFEAKAKKKDKELADRIIANFVAAERKRLGMEDPALPVVDESSQGKVVNLNSRK